MSEPEEFRWQILVLDDNISDSALDKLPQALCGSCHVSCFGSPLHQLYSIDESWKKVKSFTLPHLVLVDMQWKNFRPPDPNPAFDTEAPRKLECGTADCPCRLSAGIDTPLANGTCLEARSAFNKQWLDRIRHASHKSTTNWLPERIIPEEIGLWVAAWASHLFPKAQIALYSAYVTQIEKSQALAPWLRFRTPHTHLLHKASSEPLALEAMLPMLKKLQVQAIASDADLRRWAQQVWLCEYLGAEPPAHEYAVHRPSGGAQFLRVQAGVFFPQLGLAATEKERQRELEWLESVVFAPVSTSLVGLNSAEHALHRAFSPGEVDEDAKQRIESVLWSSLPAGGPALRHVERNEFRQAWENLWCLLHDGLPRIRRDATTAEGLPDRFPEPGTAVPGPRFPLDVVAWEALWSVLRANPQGEKYQLHARLDRGLLDLQFVGGLPFENVAEFRSRAAKSLTEKGGERGLPLLVRFATQLRARSLELLIDGRWETLAGRPFHPTTEPPAGSGGVRMTFQLQTSG